jgi:hypothetical protein
MPLDSDIAIPTFEDRLRAIGALLDRRELHAISLEINRHGVTLAAQDKAGGQAEPTVLRLTGAEVVALCQEARRRRGSGGTLARRQRPSRLAALRARQAGAEPFSRWVEQTQLPSYQEMLRAIGCDLDRWQARSCQINEGGLTFLVRVLSAGDRGGVEQVYNLDKAVLRTRVAEAIRRRKYHQPSRRASTGELTTHR